MFIMLMIIDHNHMLLIIDQMFILLLIIDKCLFC